MIDTVPTTTFRAGVPPHATGVVDARYQFAQGEHELSLRVRAADPEHAVDLRHGAAEFALVTEGPLLLLGSRFGKSIPWSFAPYSWHLVPPAARSLPPAVGSPEERRAQLDVVLTDAEDGGVVATACVTLWLDFTRALHEAIREQARLPFDPTVASRALVDLRRRYPTPAALLARASCHARGSR